LNYIVQNIVVSSKRYYESDITAISKI